MIAVAHPDNLLHCCLPETVDFFLSLSILNIAKKNPPDFAFLFYYHDSEIPCLGLHWRELSVFHRVNLLEISNWWALWTPCLEQKHHLASHTHKNLHIFPKTKTIMNRWIIYFKFTLLPLAKLLNISSLWLPGGGALGLFSYKGVFLLNFSFNFSLCSLCVPT